MLIYPDINPVALSIGPIKVHWYGLMYLLGFGLAWAVAHFRATKPWNNWSNDEISDLIFYGAIGVIVGGRIGYVIFYHFDQFLQDPAWLFKVWTGGMSFHGGLIGVLLMMALFSKKTGKSFFEITDFLAPMVPLGFAAGRLGNFIGGELWGRVASADLPWAMVFPFADSHPRHPSQLYQFALEGVALFVIVFLFSQKPRPVMSVTGLGLFGYGCFRFIVEFFRQPDAHLNFIAFDWLTMGQLLSSPMILLGILLFVFAYRNNQYPPVK